MQEGLEGVEGEVCCVEGGGRKTAKGGGEGFGREGVEDAQFPALDGFAEK